MEVTQEDLTMTTIESLQNYKKKKLVKLQAIILPLHSGIIYYSSVQDFIYDIIFKSAHSHAQSHGE